MNTSPLPQTDSIRELAKFWDAHDVTDFDHELEEVSEPVFESKQFLTLPLAGAEAEAVHQMAKSQGITDAQLVRQWVREKIESH